MSWLEKLDKMLLLLLILMICINKQTIEFYLKKIYANPLIQELQLVKNQRSGNLVLHLPNMKIFSSSIIKLLLFFKMTSNLNEKEIVFKN